MAGKLRKLQITSPASCWPVPIPHSCIFWLSLSAHGAVTSSAILYGVSQCFETQEHWCDADSKDHCFISCRQNGRKLHTMLLFVKESQFKPLSNSLSGTKSRSCFPYFNFSKAMTFCVFRIESANYILECSWAS